MWNFQFRIEASGVLKRLGLEPCGPFVAPQHREQNVDYRARQSALVGALNALVERYDMPVIVSTHPRTREKLDALGGAAIGSHVQYMKPFGFHDYNHLQMHAFCAILDSGTIAEEAAILQFPAITPRDAIERPEGLDVGSLIMAGLDCDTILARVDAVTAMFNEREATGVGHPVPDDYRIANTLERVVSLLLGTAKLSNSWDGIRKNDLT